MAEAPPILAVPFIDLARQHAEQSAELESALLDTFRKGAYCNGPTVRAFEEALSAWHGADTDTIALANGTDALVLALQALGVAPGVSVLTPTFSFFASGSAISLCGGEPVFADIDPATYCVSRATLEAAWRPGIAGLIVVHLYGHPAPMAEILAFAAEKGIWVLEDCAQAIGATLDGQPVGTFGIAGAISFYPTKNLNACGDAGALVTRDPEFAARVRLLRAHGEAPRYTHTLLGRNSRMDDFQAAILSAKLPHLARWNARRREIAALYDAAFAALPIQTPPTPDSHAQPIYHQYTLATNQREALKAHLMQRGIGCGVYYPIPLHEQPLYQSLGVAPESLPEAHRLAGQVLSLPIFPQLTAEEIAAVSEGVQSFFGK